MCNRAGYTLFDGSGCRLVAFSGKPVVYQGVTGLQLCNLQYNLTGGDYSPPVVTCGLQTVRVCFSLKGGQ